MEFYEIKPTENAHLRESVKIELIPTSPPKWTGQGNGGRNRRKSSDRRRIAKAIVDGLFTGITIVACVIILLISASGDITWGGVVWFSASLAIVALFQIWKGMFK